MRQEIVRKQIESKFEHERKEKEKRDLLASLESDKSEPKVVAPKQTLTPLIPPAALIAPRVNPRYISPVSNMLAIERAKEKVAQLKAQKDAHRQQFMPKTIAQTAPKGTGRVAHINSNAVATQVWFPFTNFFFCCTFCCCKNSIDLDFDFRMQNQRHQYWNRRQQKSHTTFECNIII